MSIAYAPGRWPACLTAVRREGVEMPL